MTAAANAMAQAVSTLGELKTAAAVTPEMDALNHLLQAQAEVKQRQVQTQQAGSGNGANRSNVDLTNLFDKELQRQQRTNYETKASAEPQQGASEIDKIRELARRQDELNARQQELARKRAEISPEELKRELEKLTRDQSDLRQQAEEEAAKLSQGKQGSQGSQGSQSSQGSQGSQASSGEKSAQAMRAASDAMRNATNSLRAQNPGSGEPAGRAGVRQAAGIGGPTGIAGGWRRRRQATRTWGHAARGAPAGR